MEHRWVLSLLVLRDGPHTITGAGSVSGFLAALFNEALLLERSARSYNNPNKIRKWER